MKKKRPTKNKILKFITIFSIFILFAGASGLDGDNLIVPAIMIAVSTIWLLIFWKANEK